MRCFYCDIVLTPRMRPQSGRRFAKGFQFPRTMWTKDHIVPRAKGGSETVPACLECNETKGILSLEEFRILIGFRKNFEDWWHGTYVFPGETQWKATENSSEMSARS